MSFLSILEAIFIGPLKLFFEIIFKFANEFVDHAGLSIIVLSIVMNILVLPLYKRADAMQKEARDTDEKLSKGVKHIRKVFSGDERMMILQTYYRQNNYKPTNALNGSVSLLLEIPFFMAAYQFLSHLDALNGVSLGPIKDLSAPDGLIVIGALTINLLPVLMTLINVISSAIYLKGFPLKTKIQLYGIALFFLVFLYTSPSGLVFYWTLNNVFSLVKNVFYKIKNPKAVLSVITAVLGIAMIVVAPINYSSHKGKMVFLICLGACLMLPLLISIVKAKTNFKFKQIAREPNKNVFVWGCVFLTVLIGVLIPATFIAASPQEYVDISYFNNPLWYILSSAATAAGFFLVWFRVFYWLASKNGKVVFDRIIWILCGVTIVNYMFFGTNLGVISPELVYNDGISFVQWEYLINIAVIAAIAVVFYFVIKKWAKAVSAILIIAAIAMGSMGGMHIYTAAKSVNKISIDQSDTIPNFNLSKTGKNVIVIMLDRALGSYLPYFFEEKPELRKQFEGFTYYTNVVSFGAYTNYGSPAMLGGYEYTPVELNKRDTESLMSKQNEALKVMPLLFWRNGYETTVCDPVYANYNWLSDTSIYDEYPEIRTFVTEGAFTDNTAKKRAVENRYRNFFCFSLMKSMPVFLQTLIYDNGNYNKVSGGEEGEEVSFTIQTVQDGSTTKAEGVKKTFVDAYNVLINLSNITKVTENENNTFLMMVNNAPHEATLLQQPDYKPTATIDNTEYDAQYGAITVDGKTLDPQTLDQKAHYQVNMATMLAVGQWLDYLREKDVYDNTKIILVSDHGRNIGQFEELILGEYDLQYFHPLLMIKDFNSNEFTVSQEFMTNADVPTLAAKDCIENPVNPMTGRPITNDEKIAHDQYIILGEQSDVLINGGNCFLPAKWTRVKDNIWDKNNWAFYEKETVLKDHRFPME